MRRKLVAGNWKMNKKIADAVVLAKEIASNAPKSKEVEVVVAPVFTAIKAVKEVVAGTGVKVAGQDCYYAAEGAFTGEVGAEFLKDAGADFVIIGHSERRQLFSERSEEVGRKAAYALKIGLTPIICIGETLVEREKEETFAVVMAQLNSALAFLPPENIKAGEAVIAYEPVWAIGTGKNATPAQAEEVHSFIRGWLSQNYGQSAADLTRILYGGSMKPDNSKELISMPNVDGGLIGGASLKAKDFVAIINSAIRQ